MLSRYDLAVHARTARAVASVEALIIAVPAVGNAFAEGAEETLVVRITDEDGVYGVGECPCTPAVIKAMIDQETIHFWSQGIKDIVIGADPIEAAAIYDRVYGGSFYHGRQGTLIQAMSAVDIALWDLAGKQLGVPGSRRATGRSPGPPAQSRFRSCRTGSASSTFRLVMRSESARARFVRLTTR